MKIAAQLYTVRDFVKTEKDIRSSFKKIKDMGYNSIQISGVGPIDPVLLNEIVKENELDICLTHMPYDRIINDTKNVISEHKLWNCDYIGIGAMNPEFRISKDGYDAFLNSISRAVDEIHDAGLKFMYHNHNFEFEKIDGALTGFEYIVNKTNPEKVGITADLYWIQAGGASPVQYIEKYADRFDIVHFKDMAVIKSEMIMAEVFEGNMGYKAIYDACIRNNIKCAAVEQDVCRRDPFDCLKTSIDNINKYCINV
ncbi:MAG: sugar phosphate isomerase/epimerase [Clostridia bacterium]|nr:sugar phosphate isomerase/epimerase [Clostridia bacterium]